MGWLAAEMITECCRGCVCCDVSPPRPVPASLWGGGGHSQLYRWFQHDWKLSIKVCKYCEIESFLSFNHLRFITDSEEESSTDSDDEEAEPKLKYERLSADLKAILKKDVASCLAVHNKFLILGSHWGVIHLLDAMGNSLPSRQAQAHTITVNQVPSSTQ